jgi:hypothetical protein
MPPVSDPDDLRRLYSALHWAYTDVLRELAHHPQDPLHPAVQEARTVLCALTDPLVADHRLETILAGAIEAEFLEPQQAAYIAEEAHLRGVQSTVPAPEGEVNGPLDRFLLGIPMLAPEGAVAALHTGDLWQAVRTYVVDTLMTTPDHAAEAVFEEDPDPPLNRFIGSEEDVDLQMHPVPVSPRAWARLTLDEQAGLIAEIQDGVEGPALQRLAVHTHDLAAEQDSLRPEEQGTLADLHVWLAVLTVPRALRCPNPRENDPGMDGFKTAPNRVGWTMSVFLDEPEGVHLLAPTGMREAMKEVLHTYVLENLQRSLAAAHLPVWSKTSDFPHILDFPTEQGALDARPVVHLEDPERETVFALHVPREWRWLQGVQAESRLGSYPLRREPEDLATYQALVIRQQAAARPAPPTARLRSGPRRS